MRYKRTLVALLALLALACNFPGFPISVTQAPSGGETQPPAQEATPSSEGGTATMPPEATTPDAEATETAPAISASETPTATPRPTDTPSPTPAPPTETPTATPPKPGPPLVFLDPAWEWVEWHKIPDTGDWEGTLRLRIQGGVPPYRSQIEDKPIEDGLEVHTRWRLCKAMPASVRVWSADGQFAETKIWVWEVGCEGN